MPILAPPGDGKCTADHDEATILEISACPYGGRCHVPAEKPGTGVADREMAKASEGRGTAGLDQAMILVNSAVPLLRIAETLKKLGALKPFLDGCLSADQRPL